MKMAKSRILKKLDSIPQVGYLKQDRTLQSNTSGKLWRALHPYESDRILCHLPICRQESNDEFIPMIVSNDKENIVPKPKKSLIKPEPSFRPPDPNSATLFDPNLLAAFRQAVMDHARRQAMKEQDPLMEFEEKCPPRGEECIILYTTSLRGIRKTFEDCRSVRFLLESLKLAFVERDLSMHKDFREEVWRILGHRAIPPRLFIKGRYVGGADKVLGLHEQGRLKPLVEGMPRDRPAGTMCEGCGGMRFLICDECDGSRRVFVSEKEGSVRCRRCNENGLVLCPLCC